MEFGIFHEFERPPGMSEAQAFTNAFDLVDVAEDGGLHAVWLAELHFNPKRSVLASPMLLAGAIGARTSKIRIGTAVQILPLCHPLQLAEEAATVDHISHGRLIFGVGRSGFARTYAAYGVPYTESRERFAETLEIVRRAWTQETFTFEGKYFEYHDVCVVPKPLQQPHPPIRVAATSVDTFPTIGAQGYDLFAAVRTGTLSELAPNVAAYRAAHASAGHPGKGGVFLRVPVYVAESFDEAVAAEMVALILGVGRRDVVVVDGPGRSVRPSCAVQQVAEAIGLAGPETSHAAPAAQTVPRILVEMAVAVQRRDDLVAVALAPFRELRGAGHLKRDTL